MFSDMRESKVLKAIKTIEYLHSILGHEFVESVSIQSFEERSLVIEVKLFYVSIIHLSNLNMSHVIVCACVRFLF